MSRAGCPVSPACPGPAEVPVGGTPLRQAHVLTELAKRVIDGCVQLHGGYGYMLEYPIARAYADVRITTIYGGTTEIMKEIIGRSLGL